MEGAQKKFITFLQNERKELLMGCDDKAKETVEQLRKEELKKKKDNQYNFKQKEKELQEHLETMTQVAQKIDDDNRAIYKRYEALKVHLEGKNKEKANGATVASEDDRDLLLKQLFYHKKEG